MRITFVTLVLAALCGVVKAQTATVVTATSRAIFSPSPDHGAVDAFGQPVVDHYDLEVIGTNGTGAIAFTKGLGKPTPISNEIAVTVPEFGGLTPNAVYRAVVAAVNATGAGRSPQSNSFGVPGPLPMPTATAALRVVP